MPFNFKEVANVIQTEIKWNLSAESYICINCYATAKEVANLWKEKQCPYTTGIQSTLPEYKKTNKHGNFSMKGDHYYYGSQKKLLADTILKKSTA